jgi:hypothetical protein
MTRGEERLAALLGGVDAWLARPGGRRTGAVAAVVVVATTAFALAPRNSPPTTPARLHVSSRAPTRRGPPRPPTAARPAPHGAGRATAFGAAASARGFLRTYLAFAYGHGRAAGIEHADRRLIAAVRRGRVPLAARARHPRIVALRIRAPLRARRRRRRRSPMAARTTGWPSACSAAQARGSSRGWPTDARVRCPRSAPETASGRCSRPPSASRPSG